MDSENISSENKITIKKEEKTMIEIQERDEKILKIIGNYGAVYNKDILREIFHNKDTYYYKRMKKLEDENYLIRKNSMFYLAVGGKKYLEGKNIEYRKINAENKSRKRAAEIYKILSRLTEFEVIPSYKIERISTNFAYKYYGIAKSKATEKEYWIYRLGKLKLKEGTENEKHNYKVKSGKQIEVVQMKNEINEICSKNVNTPSAMVFIEDREGMELFKDINKAMHTKEQILIAYTDLGLTLVNEYIGKGEGTNEKVLEKLKSQGISAKISHKEWANTDYEIEGKYGFNLTTSDFNKEKIINDYLSFSRKPENIVIVCDPIQKNKYRNQYPGCSIINLT